MRWSDRQRRMLGEMGLRVWESPPADPLPPEAEVQAPVAGLAGSDMQAAGVRAGGHALPAAATDSAAAARRLPEGGVPGASNAGRVAEPAASAPGDANRPVAGEVASMDWQALREAVAACTACQLCERRSNTVFGVGNLQAHWMIVGEAPGEHEDRRGEPFVGKAGQLLDNMLAAIGLTRADDSPQRQVFIANTLKCRPPGNRNPEPDELARCEPYLVRQVALVRPRIILAMGRFAVQSLLRSDEPVGRLRGRVHRYQGVPLIVTYHPAYLLRNLDDKARAWEDLCLAREVATQSGGG